MLDVLNLPKPQNGYIDYFSGDAPTTAGITSTSWRTWEKPRGISTIHITCFGAGGGGGSGLGGASFGFGAGGGGSGGQTTLLIPAHVLPDVLYVSPGKGGRGATSDGLSVLNGIASYVSIAPSIDAIYVVCFANGGFGSISQGAGAGGIVVTQANALMSSQGFFFALAGHAGGSGNSAALRNVTYPATGLLLSGGAGGGGGNATRGGNGGSVTAPTQASFSLITSRGGGAEGTGNPGDDGISLFQPLMSIGGGGGSGQGSTANVIVGNGGHGGFGSGGGGMGVTGSTTPVGKSSGNGGDGLVIIQCF
jgi:hypothetical protein